MFNHRIPLTQDSVILLEKKMAAGILTLQNVEQQQNAMTKVANFRHHTNVDMGINSVTKQIACKNIQKMISAT